MKFSELLREAIESAEIPLRFEPGAADAVAQPILELLAAWIAIHDPDDPQGEFEYGRKALIVRLLEELKDREDIPVH